MSGRLWKQLEGCEATGQSHDFLGIGGCNAYNPSEYALPEIGLVGAPGLVGLSGMKDVLFIESGRSDVVAELRKLRESLILDRLVLDETDEVRVVRDIIGEVRRRGDEALSEMNVRFDGATVPPDGLRVPAARLKEAHDRLEPDLLQAIRHSIESIRAFQQTLLQPMAAPASLNGKTMSLRRRPLRRVGVCVPGAAAPLPSSAIHCAVPAQVAGVGEIVLVAPPRHQGDIHPTILGVAYELGISEVYRVGGAQAVAALAIGTQRIRAVDKIVGPGSVYVQLAKRALYGVADIDMFAGPSEVVIVADRTARAEFVAADMLAQAEHDPGSSILLTDDAQLAAAVREQLNVQLESLSRREGAVRSLKQYAAIVVVREMLEALVLANEIAPEHLQIEAARPYELAERIDAAGAIFIGHHTPEAAGDYVAGPSHVLPTGGTARFWSGISVLSFLRYTSVMEYSRAALAHDAAAIDRLARAEGLDAHARSVTIRTDYRHSG